MVLLDAASVREHAADPLLADTVLRQLRAPDLLVLNQCDRVALNGLAEIAGEVLATGGSAHSCARCLEVVVDYAYADVFKEVHEKIAKDFMATYPQYKVIPRSCTWL